MNFGNGIRHQCGRHFVVNPFKISLVQSAWRQFSTIKLHVSSRRYSNCTWQKPILESNLEILAFHLPRNHLPQVAYCCRFWTKYSVFMKVACKRQARCHYHNLVQLHLRGTQIADSLCELFTWLLSLRLRPNAVAVFVGMTQGPWVTIQDPEKRGTHYCQCSGPMEAGPSQSHCSP